MRPVFLANTRTALAAGALALAASCALADSQARQKQDAPVTPYKHLTYPDTGVPFLEERERGWHWYEDPEDDQEQEQPAPPPPPSAQAEEPAAPQGPKPLSSEWLKANMPKFLNRAIDEPTHENVAAYLYLQKLTLKKADKFSDAVKVVTAKEPWLDANAEIPISTAGSSIAANMGSEMRAHIVKKLAKNNGILFFFRSDCKYCHQQWPLLRMYAKETGFSIMPVSLDGGLLPGMDPATVQLDRGQSRLFGVAVTPTLFLFEPKTRNAMPISNGFIALDDISPTIIRMAEDAGLVSEKDFEMAKGNLLLGTNGPGPLTPELLMQQASEQDVSDSKSLYDYMKGKLKAHGQR